MSLLLTLAEAAGGGGGGGFDSGLLSNGDLATGDLTDWVVDLGSWEHIFVDPYNCFYYKDQANSSIQNVVGKRHVWKNNTVYRLSWRWIAGTDTLINIYDGGNNYYGNITDSAPGVYTFDIDTTGKTLVDGVNDGLRLYGRTLDHYGQFTELSLKEL